MGPAMHGSCPGPCEQPSMEEELRGQKQKKRVLAENGTRSQRCGMEGVETNRKKEEKKTKKEEEKRRRMERT